MKQKELEKRLKDAVPGTPEGFHARVEATLNGIVSQEANDMKESTKYAIRRAGRVSTRAAAIVIAVTLLLGAAAVAESQWHIFDVLSFMVGKPAGETAENLMQGSLYQETINNVEITVREAGYDGRTLFLEYSYRMLDVDTPFGGQELNEEFMSNLGDLSVGWWIDCLWINGKAVDMANNSGGITSGSDVPGEIIQTEFWRLDNENVRLEGPVQISLPIGEKQPLSEYSRKNHPEKYDADGKLKLPEKGVVTFTYDAGDILRQVKTLHPNEEKALDEGTVRVSEAAFTPLMTYIILDMQVNPDALAAYIAEHGEGQLNEDGQVMFPFDGLDVFTEWVMSAELVDGQGNLVFPEHHGNNGYGSDWAEFLYPAMDALPDALYLAPVIDGIADMSRAVVVKPANQ